MAGSAYTPSTAPPDHAHQVTNGSRKGVATLFGVLAAIVLLFWVASILARRSGGKSSGDGSD